MDKAGIAFAIPLIVLPLFFLPAVLRSTGEMRVYGTVAAVSAIALGIVKILLRTGQIEEGPAYWTLNYSLSALFFVTLLLGMYLARASGKRATS